MMFVLPICGVVAVTVITVTVHNRDSQELLIKGIIVPPEPPIELNNQTIAGIDSDGNGVRDDVDRWIARASQDITEFKNLLTFGKIYQLMLTDPDLTQSKYDDYAHKIDCANEKATSRLNSDQIELLVVNTPDRIESYTTNLERIKTKATSAFPVCE